MDDEWDRKAIEWAHSAQQDTAQIIYSSRTFLLATSSYAQRTHARTHAR